MDTALVYVRQSRNREYERTVSPETQEAACRALPAVQGCSEVIVHSDLDISGGKRGRRGYLTMLEAIRNGAVSVVAAYDQSRLARSVWIWAEFQELLAARPAISVVYAHGSFDRSAIARFAQVNLAAAHQLEREMVGEKVREAKRYAASHGQMVGAVPLGYQWEGDGRGRRLVVDEEAAEVVRRIFSDYLEGRGSTNDLARRLNAEGIPHPRSGREWRRETVADILGNPCYAGLTYVNRKHREGDLLRAEWPAIIGRSDWEAARVLLDRRRHGGGKGGSQAERPVYAFGGMLRCAQCGRRLHVHTLHPNTPRATTYYRCRGEDRADPCKRGIREDRLLAWGEHLMEALDRYRPPGFADAVEQAQRDREPHHHSPSALAQLDATIKRTNDVYRWGHMPEEEYLVEVARLQKIRVELVALEEHGTIPGLPVGSLAQGWLEGGAVVRRRLLETLFEEIDVRDGQVVSVAPSKLYAAEVVALLEFVRTDSHGDPGGVRTRDLSLERAAS